jgi:hypothetical protein
MPDRDRLLNTILSVIGAAVGGFIGYQVFFWVVDQGFYGMMIPGGLLGLGCGVLARYPSQLRGILCGLAGLALGIYTEWKFAPFVADGSFVYLLTHFHQILPVHLLMIILGAGFAYWLGKDGGFVRLPSRKSPID